MDYRVDKKNKQKAKQRIIRSIVILLVLLVAIIAIMIIYQKTDELQIAKKKIEYIKSDEWNGELFPDGMPAFFRSYKGSLTAQNMGKSLYYVTTEVIPKYYSELKDKNEAEIKEYYSKKSEVIKYNLGITTESQFIKFAQEIKKLNSDNIEFESYYVDDDSITIKNGKKAVDLHIKYKNCSEIVLQILVANTASIEGSPIIYSK